MKKTKLVIASVLKPVDDTRMYEKFGLSLGQTTKYAINIIGFWVKKIPDVPSLTFHPIFKFKRLSIKRLLAPTRFFILLLKLKPELIIINTHELLLVAGLYKILFGASVLYDIRENYYRNILYTQAFPVLLRPLLAGYVRGKEYMSRLFIDHYLLAEYQYEKEFTFSRGKSTVIENKFKPVDGLMPRDKRNGMKLLFSGTLAESTGVFHAIRYAKLLHAIEPLVTLHIIGHCAIPSTLSKIKRICENHSFIRLTGGEELVTHIEILRAICEADFGIIYYPKNYSTMNTVPTKLYEYLGLHLPILLQDHKPWVTLAQAHNACLVLHDENTINNQLVQEMKSAPFYQNSPYTDILWQSEEIKLIGIINDYIHN